MVRHDLHPAQPGRRLLRQRHRNAFHGALRTWAAGEFAAGRVTIEQLRDAAAAAVHGA